MMWHGHSRVVVWWRMMWRRRLAMWWRVMWRGLRAGPLWMLYHCRMLMLVDGANRGVGKAGASHVRKHQVLVRQHVVIDPGLVLGVTPQRLRVIPCAQIVAHGGACSHCILVRDL